jgi:RimJ/RimL family protein N-acetyltransferase
LKVGEYAKNLIINDLDVIKYNSADNKTIRLLVYSIFWRASISEHELFKNFRIVLEFEEELRAILMTYRFNNRKDYQIALTSKPNFKICPYTIITAKSFNDETANVLFAPYSLDPYALVVDRFGFMLYRIQGDIKVDFIKEFSNINPDDCKMMVFSEQLWHDTIVKGAFELLAKKTISYTMGKIYLLNKSNFVEEVLDEIPDIKFKLCRTISPEDYLKLKVLIELAKIELAEEPTTFGETSFTRDSATKDDICFTICLAVCQSDIIGYGIAYILKDKFTDQLLNEYYLDIVFVNKLYRGKQVSREIVNNLIKFVTTEDKVNVIKAKTQVSNLPAQRLLESFGFESLRS